jgi:E3 ubiquitin-protein ligase HUWE1
LNQLQHRQRQISTSVGEPANQEAQPNAGGEAPAVGNQPPAEEDILDQEFLAALPPELQEDVLAHHEQRLAQQAARNAVANPNAGAAIDAPGADAIAFLDSLNPSLRAQVLADADDTVILPENLTHYLLSYFL